MSHIRIGIVGARGRMGRAVASIIEARPECVIAGGAVRPGSVDVGTRFGVKGQHEISDDLSALAAASDILIEFAGAEGALAATKAASKAGIALLVGSTGLDDVAEAEIAEFARDIPVLRARNTSAGVALLTRLVQEAATALGPDYDIEIIEHHHGEKRDAPSGTALQLGEAAARGRGAKLNDLLSDPRRGSDQSRRRGSIGIASLRGGSNPGEHSIIFAGPSEQIGLSHRAASSRLFAEGAVTAALWLAGQPAGFYSMEDVLGL